MLATKLWTRMHRGRDGSNRRQHQLELFQTPAALQQKGETETAMDESKSSPLDGILEEAAANKETVGENHKPSSNRVTNISGNHSGPDFLQEDGVRRLREIQSADVTSIQHQLKTLQAMILALRGAIGAIAIASILALLKARKLEKRVGELEGKKVIEVEAITTKASAPVVEAVQVGD
jgi:hypothetical protein